MLIVVSVEFGLGWIGWNILFSMDIYVNFYDVVKIFFVIVVIVSISVISFVDCDFIDFKCGFCLVIVGKWGIVSFLVGNIDVVIINSDIVRIWFWIWVIVCVIVRFFIIVIVVIVVRVSCSWFGSCC